MTEQQKQKRYIKSLPNIITTIRILGTVVMIFTTSFTVPFYAVYITCGVTDVLDGFVARHFKLTSEFGAKLDSMADLFFFFITLVKTLPVLWVTLPKNIWVIFGIVLFLRLIMYLKYAIKDHEFGSEHTYLNKLTGLTVFGIALIIKTPIAVPYCYTSVSIALVAVLYELFIRSRIIGKPGNEDE